MTRSVARKRAPKGIAQTLPREHATTRNACGQRFLADALWHLCRHHVIGSGECLCPCGARRSLGASEGRDGTKP